VPASAFSRGGRRSGAWWQRSVQQHSRHGGGEVVQQLERRADLLWIETRFVVSSPTDKSTVRRYIRSGDLWQENASAWLGL
jgi:hypothetical protein